MMRFLALSIIALLICAGCGTPRGNTSLDVSLPQGGTLQNYRWAISATDLSIRKARLEAFLTEYTPSGDGGYEDSLHIRCVRNARYDLLQALYLLGHDDSANKVLKQLRDSDRDIVID